MSPTNNKDDGRTGAGLKRKLIDDQFEFQPIEDWRKHTKTGQPVLGSEFHTIEPTEVIPDVPKVVEFLYKKQQPNTLSLGQNTYFQVTGRFEKRSKPQDTQIYGDWTETAATDVPKFTLAPNWWSHLITVFEIWHGDVKIWSSDEARHVPAWLEAWLYASMHADLKKKLMPQKTHPGYCVPTDFSKWIATGTAADSQYLPYANLVVGKSNFTFDWIPFQVPFFFQNPNYLEPGEVQRILPTHDLDDIKIRFQFADDQGTGLIFKNVATNTDQYRFKLLKLELKCEQYRLNPHFKAAPKSTLTYLGTTRILKMETIQAGERFFRVELKNAQMPEGFVFFFLPKDVVGGTYNFKDMAERVFTKHNIERVTLSYKDRNLFYKEPHPGMIKDQDMNRKLYFDYLNQPPFGVKFCPDLLTYEAINDGWADSCYPHVFINMLNFGDKSRIVPFQDNNGNLYDKPEKLEMNITFNPGAPAASTLFVYMYFTDNNLTLDMKDKHRKFFASPYVKLPQIS